MDLWQHKTSNQIGEWFQFLRALPFAVGKADGTNRLNVHLAEDGTVRHVDYG